MQLVGSLFGLSLYCKREYADATVATTPPPVCGPLSLSPETSAFALPIQTNKQCTSYYLSARGSVFYLYQPAHLYQVPSTKYQVRITKPIPWPSTLPPTDCSIQQSPIIFIRCFGLGRQGPRAKPSPLLLAISSFASTLRLAPMPSTRSPQRTLPNLRFCYQFSFSF